MESPLVLESENNMLADDLFEGWLSVPIDDLNRYLPNAPLKHTPISMVARSPQQDVALRLTRGLLPGPDFESNPPTPTNSAPVDTVARKRRGHAKSRLGCIDCKKRKVKCQETWPACANCIRRGSLCTYPASKHAQHDRVVSEALSNPRPYVQLSDTPRSSTYNANDMQLFHHFLVSAHPVIPPNFEYVWVKDVPTFSHQYEYLMHAILAMSGSHLDLMALDPKPYAALSHRQKAIEGLENALTQWPPPPTEAHVMLATSYLLAFQSSYLSDGMLDHILSLRGCAMLSQLIITHQFHGAFSAMPDLRDLYMNWKSRRFPSLDPLLAREALQSMKDFAPHLAASEEHKIERDILAQLVECIRPLLVPQPTESPVTPGLTGPMTESTTSEDETSTTASSGSTFPPVPASTPEPWSSDLYKHPLSPAARDVVFESIIWDTITEAPPYHTPQPIRSFNGLMGSLNILATSAREPVLNLFASTNVLGNIVMAHFCCTRFIIAPLCAPESAMKTPLKAMLVWCEKVVDGVKDEDGDGVKWTRYVEWPRKILRTMRRCLDQKKALMFCDLYDILMNNPRAFTEGLHELPQREK